MARITVEDCIDKFPSRFELVLVASNRARKLHSGENPTIDKDNDKNTVIALREIADETISVEDFKNSLVEEYQTVSAYDEEDLSVEHSEKNEDNNNEDNISSNDINIDTAQNEMVKDDNLVQDTAIDSEENLDSISNDQDQDNIKDQDSNSGTANSE